MAFVVAGVAVVGSDERWAIACSCGDNSVYAAFDDAGLAFVGTPTGIVTDSTGTFVTFSVTRWVKGTGGATVELQMSNLSGSFCGDMSVPIGDTIGVITNVPSAGRPSWPQLCSSGLQTPPLLDLLAAGTMPAPTGSGPVVGLLDLRYEAGLVVLLDAANRPLGYVDGLEGPLSVCPGGATFTAGTATSAGTPVQLVNVSSLSVRTLGTPTGFAADSAACIEPDGTLFFGGTPWPPTCFSGCPREYREWDGEEWVLYPTPPVGQHIARVGLTVAVLDGDTLTLWNLTTGTADAIITLPPHVGWPTFRSSPESGWYADLSTLYLPETSTLLRIIDVTTNTSTTITIVDPPLDGDGDPLLPSVTVINDTIYMRYTPDSGGDDNGFAWFVLGADGTLTPVDDPLPSPPPLTGGLFDVVAGGAYVIPMAGSTAVNDGACGTSGVTIGSFDCTPLVIPPTA